MTVTTSPAGLSVEVTYEGRHIMPTQIGNDAVPASVIDPIHTGLATGTLVIESYSGVVDPPAIESPSVGQGGEKTITLQALSGF